MSITFKNFTTKKENQQLSSSERSFAEHIKKKVKDILGIKPIQEWTTTKNGKKIFAIRYDKKSFDMLDVIEMLGVEYSTDKLHKNWTNLFFEIK